MNFEPKVSAFLYLESDPLFVAAEAAIKIVTGRIRSGIIGGMNRHLTERIIHLMGGIKYRMGGTCKTLNIHDLNQCVKFAQHSNIQILFNTLGARFRSEELLGKGLI
jgi:hypothetical protein